MNIPQISILWLLLIIPVCLGLGFGLCSWYISYTLKKALGIRSWKEFLAQQKKARELQKKMEKEGIMSVMNDPVLRKQMEELQKRFRKS